MNAGDYWGPEYSYSYVYTCWAMYQYTIRSTLAGKKLRKAVLKLSKATAKANVTLKELGVVFNELE